MGIGRVTRCFSSFSGFLQFILSLFPGGIVVKDSRLVLEDWDCSWDSSVSQLLASSIFFKSSWVCDLVVQSLARLCLLVGGMTFECWCGWLRVPLHSEMWCILSC